MFASSNGRISCFSTTIPLRKSRKTEKIIKDICLKTESQGCKDMKGQDLRKSHPGRNEIWSCFSFKGFC